VPKFRFIARCGEQTMPLEVNLAYRPGKQAQRARRVAVGELLAALGAETASVDAAGEDQVRVTTPEGIWIIGEGGPLAERRSEFRAS
jgi:hypothetical protein